MITILCSGSRGDLQPYIALAQELKALGRPVRIVGGSSFEGFIKSYGIDVYPLSADYLSTDLDPKFLQDALSSDNPLKMLFTFNKMKKFAVGLTEEMFDACKDSDLIIYHPGCTIGYFAGKQLGIPSVLASPFPMHKTKEIASVIAYGKTKMPNVLSYNLLQGMLWMAGKTGIKTFYKWEFGKLPSNFGIPFERVDREHPAIISCSNHVFPKPKDWSKHIHQYGYWFAKEEIEYVPSEELSDFLGKGEKPIYIGFGSVYDSNRKDEIVKLFTEALKRTGKRGILSGLGEIQHLPANMLAIGSIPHSWLFQQVSVVCHHGGAGTTAAGFRAGVPSIIIPFSNDQFAWAHRAYDIGVGSKPIYRKALSVDKLVSAIEYTQQDHIVANAKGLGMHIAKENGAMECAKIVAQLLESN